MPLSLARKLVLVALFQALVLALAALAELWVRVAGSGPGFLGTIVVFALGGALVVATVAAPGRLWGVAPPVSFALAAAVLALPRVPFLLRSGAHAALAAERITTAAELSASFLDGPATLTDARVETTRGGSHRWTTKGARHEVYVAPLVDGAGEVRLWACTLRPERLDPGAPPVSGWYTRAPDYGYGEAIARTARGGEPTAGCLVLAGDDSAAWWLGALPMGLLGALELVVLVGLARR